MVQSLAPMVKPLRLYTTQWWFRSPAPLPSDLVAEFRSTIEVMASRSDDADGVLLHFARAFREMSRLAPLKPGASRRDVLEAALLAAADNAPLCIRAFVYAFDVAGGNTGGWTSRESLLHSIELRSAFAIRDETILMLVRPEARTFSRRLRVFLCHASEDRKTVDRVNVSDLHKRLEADGFDPWLDVKRLLPGDEWEAEIRSALRQSHIAVICLSSASVTKVGFIQKEIGAALDYAAEHPQGVSFLIPARLEECALPTSLQRWHAVNLFDDDGYPLLVKALRKRESKL